MSSNPTAGRRMTLSLAGLIAVASTTLLLAVSGTHEGHADTGHSHTDAVAVSAKTNAKQAAFHDATRKLWEDHVTWTRLAIISLAHDLPDLPATQARLLRNQVDIGNAIKPYYGRAAGNQLTALLKEHIVGAVALLQAAKAGARLWSSNAAQSGTPTATRSPTSCTTPTRATGPRRRCAG
jgi:hypothetical protein